jgi:hypothetical protein
MVKNLWELRVLLLAFNFLLRTSLVEPFVVTSLIFWITSRPIKYNGTEYDGLVGV